MKEKIEKKSFFKGREIVTPKGWPDEVIKDEKIRIIRDREYTRKVIEKNQLEKEELGIKAKRFSFGELLVSEEKERPGVEPNFPLILTIPDRYPTNYALIQGFVPKNRLEEATDGLFFHERLHTIGESAKHQNIFGARISEEKMQLIEKFEKFENVLAQTEKAPGNMELIRLMIDGAELEKENKAMLEKISNYEEEQEIITDHQLMEETSNIDVLASLMLIDPMLSHGIPGARIILNEARTLQKKGPSFDFLVKELMGRFKKTYPRADKEKLEELMESYIKIGGEILEGFDAWEKGRMKIVYRSRLNRI